ncbi:universal stress protein [Mucilaginibacter sp.]|uniref:universal stress protein n=1 Tax=Mucilaginibacter sp. TaxID=1882438 RepID=UPI0035BBA777
MANKRTILLLTDFTKRAERAADMALELAINSNADLLIYNSIVSIEASVITGERRSPDKEIEVMDHTSGERLDQLWQYLRTKMTSEQQAAVVITCKKGMGPVMETITELVSENVIWLVVMGNHVDKTIATLYFDSNIPSVMNYCGCPLLLVP